MQKLLKIPTAKPIHFIDSESLIEYNYDGIQ